VVPNDPVTQVHYFMFWSYKNDVFNNAVMQRAFDGRLVDFKE
jgi:hypothetical protein